MSCTGKADCGCGCGGKTPGSHKKKKTIKGKKLVKSKRGGKR